MSDVEPAVPDPRDMRCSDTDREAVAEVLRGAMADGRLDYDELSDRLDKAYAALDDGRVDAAQKQLDMASRPLAKAEKTLQ